MSKNANFEVNQDILRHPGKQIVDALSGYSMSKDILSGNGLQLRHLVVQLEDPADPLGIHAVERRQVLQNLFGEVIRLFHNFLTSITTFIDHTRNLVGTEKREKGKLLHPGAAFIVSEHRREHQRKVDAAFTHDPLARFMKECRNYVTHHALPITGLTTTILSDSESTVLNINLEAMLKEGKWSRPAYDFMINNRPAVRILTLIDEYENKARTFHEDFVLTFDRYYGREMAAVFALMEESNRDHFGIEGSA